MLVAEHMIDKMVGRVLDLGCREENCSMSMGKHDVESKGAKARDHAPPRRPFWKHAHKDWRVWMAVLLMLALMLVYVITDNLSHRPGQAPSQPMPAIAP
jgi:hypothetical protein